MKFNLRTLFGNVMHMATDPLVGPGAQESSTLSSSPILTYDQQVAAINAMFNGTSAYGSPLMRNIVAVRSVLAIGQGIKVTLAPDVTPEMAARELDWVHNFLNMNALDEEVPQQWAEESNIEGKCLARLLPNDDGTVRARFVSYTSRKYKIHTDPDDYGIYTKATWKDADGQNPVMIPPAEFAYGRFGGRSDNPNITPPRIGAVVQNIENVGRALQDWRVINHLYGSPTPFFHCENEAEVKRILADLAGMKWQLGQTIASTTGFELVTMPAGAVESIKEELVNNVQIISGSTDVPVHLLGFPNLMSNRSTADSVMEMSQTTIGKDRHVWHGFYEELVHKAMRMANLKQAGLIPERIAIQITETSDAKMKELGEVWLPMLVAGAISLETFLSHVPEVDPPEEMERIENENDAGLEPRNVVPEDEDEPEPLVVVEGGAAA